MSKKPEMTEAQIRGQLNRHLAPFIERGLCDSALPIMQYIRDNDHMAWAIDIAIVDSIVLTDVDGVFSVAVSRGDGQQCRWELFERDGEPTVSVTKAIPPKMNARGIRYRGTQYWFNILIQIQAQFRLAYDLKRQTNA